MSIGRPPIDPAIRFWSKVDKHGPRAGRLGRCWIWTAAQDRDGYGWFRIGGRGSKMEKAHRVAWGDVPENMLVLHRCDNPPCVRRSHLFLGRHLENQQDKVAKGRHSNSRKTHCKRRHPFTAANTYIDARGHRMCRACHRMLERGYERRAA